MCEVQRTALVVSLLSAEAGGFWMRTGITAQGYFVVRTANNTGHMSEFVFGAI